MLSDLPAELLLNILSFLDNLDPVSASNRTLSASVRDYQASQLRGRLARIRQADLLMSIWSPPTFFRRSNGRGRAPVYASHSRDLINVLCDPAMSPLVEAYIRSLEEKAWIAERVAEHLLALVSFSGLRSGEERISFAYTLVVYLWSAHQRYGHDRDGYLSTLTAGYTFQDVIAADRYLDQMSSDIRGWLVSVYTALSRSLRPPFANGEGMWLYRLIVQDGMDVVLTMLEEKRSR